MVDNSSAEKSGKAPVWLIASVALNIFLIGFFAGNAPRMWFHHMRPGDGHHMVSRGGDYFYRGAGGLHLVARAVHDMPEGVQQKFRQEFLSTTKQLKPLIGEMHAGMRETIEIVSSDPVDLDKLNASFEKQNATRSQISAVTQAAVLDFIGQLSDEERSQLSKALKASWEDRKTRRWDFHKNGNWKGTPSEPQGSPPDGSPPPDGMPPPDEPPTEDGSPPE